MAKWYGKRPAEVLQFAQDFTAWLDGDTIASAEWTVPAGLTASGAVATATGTAITLSGGTLGITYEIVCRITTAGGEVKERTAWLEVVPW